MYVKEEVRSYSPSRLKKEASALLCVALNVDSPTGLFRDSAGYTMLLQRTYAAQLAAAKKRDKQLHISEEQEKEG